MKKFIKSIIPVLLLSFILLLPCLALADADNPVDRMEALAGDSGYEVDGSDTELPVAIGNVIEIILSLLGVLFLVLFIYAGVMWMIAAGNEDKITTAKHTMRRAIIGLIIVVGSYAIAQFVVYSIISS